LFFSSVLRQFSDYIPERNWFWLLEFPPASSTAAFTTPLISDTSLLAFSLPACANILPRAD